MKNNSDIDNQIISQINECFSEINSKLAKKEENSDSKITQYFLINKAWLEKYLSINKKESIFKELIYFMLQKMPLSSPKYIYNDNLNNYYYLNNFKLIPTDILPHFLSIINNNKNNSKENNIKNCYAPSKIIISSSKIIIILEEEMSLEILNKNIIPEYLLSFNGNQNINIDQMINIFIKEMKLNIPENSKNNILYNYVTNNGIKITIINLEKILEQEKLEKNIMSKDNHDKMNQLWENKYKIKMDKQLNEINNKYNIDFQKQINLNAEKFNENLKNQVESQNKIFKDNYNYVVNKLNDSRINNDNQEIKNKNKDNNNEEDDKNKISVIIDNYFDKENLEEKNKDKDKDKKFDGYEIVDDINEINFMEENNKKPLTKENLNSIIAPILFCLSQMNSLREFFNETKESINLYKFIEDHTLSAIILDFFNKLKELKEEEISESQKDIYTDFSNLIIDALLLKIKDTLYNINSVGYILSLILQNLDTEQNNYDKYISEAQEKSNIVLMNKDNKTYDIYNEQEMLQKFIDNNSINHKTFIFNKYNNIIKTIKLCKGCNQNSYEYQSFPTLNIFLYKGKPINSDNETDYEMYNALLCKINFPENISQLLSPSYLSKKIQFCSNCNKNNEIIYNKSIFLLKEYLIINIDRKNDPKNEMIFIYPEILDLRNQSQCILNLYQLVGVISKKINENNYTINDDDNDNTKYICYFKKMNEDKWIYFDENYKSSELENKNDIFKFKGVSVLFYSKIENE